MISSDGNTFENDTTGMEVTDDPYREMLLFPNLKQMALETCARGVPCSTLAAVFYLSSLFYRSFVSRSVGHVILSLGLSRSVLFRLYPFRLCFHHKLCSVVFPVSRHGFVSRSHPVFAPCHVRSRQALYCLILYRTGCETSHLVYPPAMCEPSRPSFLVPDVFPVPVPLFYRSCFFVLSTGCV